MTFPFLCIFQQVTPPFSLLKRLASTDNVHKLSGAEEDVLGPILGVLVRWADVSQYKVSKHCYIFLLPSLPQTPQSTQSDSVPPAHARCHLEVIRVDNPLAPGDVAWWKRTVYAQYLACCLRCLKRRGYLFLSFSICMRYA